MTGALVPVLSLFALIALGVLAGRLRVLGAGALDTLNRFAFLFAFPALAFTALWRAPPALLFDWRLYAAQLPGLAASVLAVVVAAQLLRVPPRTMAAGAFAAAWGNAAYLGFPLVILALGADALPAAAAIAGLYLVLAIPFGTYVTLATTHAPQGGRRSLPRQLAATPLLWAVVLGLAGSVVRVRLGLPDALPPLDLLGAGASAVALFALGLFLAETPLTRFRAHRGFLAAVVAAKLLVFPAAVWTAIRVVGLPAGDVTGASLAQAAVPVGITAFTVTRELGGDETFAAAGVVVTTLLALVTLPVVLSVFAGV